MACTIKNSLILYMYTCTCILTILSLVNSLGLKNLISKTVSLHTLILLLPFLKLDIRTLCLHAFRMLTADDELEKRLADLDSVAEEEDDRDVPDLVSECDSDEEDNDFRTWTQDDQRMLEERLADLDSYSKDEKAEEEDDDNDLPTWKQILEKRLADLDAYVKEQEEEEDDEEEEDAEVDEEDAEVDEEDAEEDAVKQKDAEEIIELNALDLQEDADQEEEVSLQWKQMLARRLAADTSSDSEEVEEEEEDDENAHSHQEVRPPIVTSEYTFLPGFVPRVPKTKSCASTHVHRRDNLSLSSKKLNIQIDTSLVRIYISLFIYTYHLI